ncbi:ionotropic receptor 21a-like isoform X2 [Macrobrachium rosenbergii]|uniref:ionotropic receptor 21a-like isoform X2 n=1 Tax=Macrobrachium rosenbergii TaxID=79674 RepID=UPI0034D426C3
MTLRAFLIVVFSLNYVFSNAGKTFSRFTNKTTETLLKDGAAVIQAVLTTSPRHSNALLFIVQEKEAESLAVMQVLLRQELSWGYGVFKVSRQANSTQDDFFGLIRHAKKFRQLSWNIMVVVVSEDPKFIKAFADHSLQGRLLVWSSRLLLVTGLPLSSLQSLLKEHWTFSMMNAIVINAEMTLRDIRWNIYNCLPYSTSGAVVVRIASWTNKRGLTPFGNINLFPEKYSNFHGATVNITALTYAPYWTTIKTDNPDGTVTETYKGTDAMLLKAIAGALNFKVYNIPTKNWDEVAQRVTERASFIAPVEHFVFPQRMDRYDYSYAYEFASMAFCASKPKLSPKWEALYYPLADAVWLAVLVVLLIVPVMLFALNRISHSLHQAKRIRTGFVAEVIVGTLLSQPLSKWLPMTASVRVLMTTWLVFAFIIGTVYRGNLTASLTLPKYPPRAETIGDLIKTVDSVISPPYGGEFRAFFLQSDSVEFQTLARLMDVGPTVMEGLQRAADNNEAYLDARRYIELNIAQYFTRADGSTKLYVGRENVMPGLAAWPIPYDAPFRSQLDRLMVAVLEGGLYEKWGVDTLNEARLESQRRQKQLQVQQAAEEKLPTDDEEQIIRSLTITHLQGPFLLLILGLAMAAFSLVGEIVAQNHA